MSYSTELTRLVADQLSRFVTLNRYQLAGHVANLDFWLAEVRHCMEVVDGYGKRFQRLKTAQAKHIAEHHTTEFALDDPCCTQQMPAAPRKIPDREFRDLRLALCDATRRFLLRCCREGFIEEGVLRQAFANLGIEIDATDLRSR